MISGRRSVNIYDYPEHLNPFFEEDHHNRIRFWDRGKRIMRANSFSISDIKKLPRKLSFRSKSKTDTQSPRISKYPASTSLNINQNSSYHNINGPEDATVIPVRPSSSLGFCATDTFNRSPRTDTLSRKKKRAPLPPNLNTSKENVFISKESLQFTDSADKKQRTLHSTEVRPDTNPTNVIITPVPTPRKKVTTELSKEQNLVKPEEIPVVVVPVEPDIPELIFNNDMSLYLQENSDTNDINYNNEVSIQIENDSEESDDISDATNKEEEIAKPFGADMNENIVSNHSLASYQLEEENDELQNVPRIMQDSNLWLQEIQKLRNEVENLFFDDMNDNTRFETHETYSEAIISDANSKTPVKNVENSRNSLQKNELNNVQ